MTVEGPAPAGFARRKLDVWLDGSKEAAQGSHPRRVFRYEEPQRGPEFYEAALAAAGTDNGRPHAPHYTSTYGAFVRDHRATIEAVCRGP